jgi:hypothetical protein
MPENVPPGMPVIKAMGKKAKAITALSQFGMRKVKKSLAPAATTRNGKRIWASKLIIKSIPVPVCGHVIGKPLSVKVPYPA